MKHVFSSHAEVCHVWANNWEEVGHGRSGSRNLFFEGATIYSYGYHFPMAHWVDERTVEITDRSYSASTSKHMYLVRRAIPNHVTQVICRTPGGNARDNYEHCVSRAQELHEQASRRRIERYSDFDLAQAERYMDSARVFAKRAGIRMPKGAAAALKTIKRQRAAEAEARRERERKAAEEQAKLRAKIEAAWESLKPVWRRDGTLSNEVLEQAKIDFDLPDTVSRASFHNVSIAMRLVGDEIETTWGARFPAEHGIRAFRVLKGLWEKGKTWTRAGLGPRLGHYRIDKVGPDYVRAGCHTVPRAEVELMAATLAVSDIETLPMKEAVNA